LVRFDVITFSKRKEKKSKKEKKTWALPPGIKCKDACKYGHPVD
jgi:hypothetical protein